MGLREERVAKNEAVAREINEQIEQAVESIPPGSFVHIICECGYDTCDLFIAVLKEEYEEVRDDSRQFIVRDDGVYLIEVNPRASRTVPFMSKVTGVPMVELAVRISLGETLADLGWPNGLLEPPPFVAVKAPAFSTAKLGGVDPSVGPGMQSTGEVIGIDTDLRVALAKALVGASLVPPRSPAGDPGDEPVALLSIADRDKAGLIPLARALRRAGYRLAGTPGTRTLLREAGFGVIPVAKLGAVPDAAIGEIGILEAIAAGDVRLVVNTPTPRSGVVRDAAEIRFAATAEGILCLTAIETAVAAAEALDPEIAARISEVRSLGEWVPSPGSPRKAAAAAAADAVPVGASG
jgi:carbamoyl-phosphate synthase large subunit